MENVLNVELEHIQQEEVQQHVQIVEQENIHQLVHHHVQLVHLELMDHQQQIVNVQLVHLVIIHHPEQKNVLNVIQFVEEIV